MGLPNYNMEMDAQGIQSSQALATTVFQSAMTVLAVYCFLESALHTVPFAGFHPLIEFQLILAAIILSESLIVACLHWKL